MRVERDGLEGSSVLIGEAEVLRGMLGDDSSTRFIDARFECFDGLRRFIDDSSM